jgi:hypothetical protein
MSSDVRDINALRQLRFAFQQSADRIAEVRFQLLTAAQRVIHEIAQSRAVYWKRELELSQRRLQAAQEALSRKQIASSESVAPGSSDARHLLHVARRRTQLCEQRILACREWSRQMQRELDRFVGHMGPLHAVAEQQLPGGIALLDRWLELLDRYQEAAPPPTPQVSP